MSYAGMRGGPGIRVDVQDVNGTEVFISVENNAFAQFAVGAFETNGDLWFVDTVNPDNSFLHHSTGISDVQGIAQVGDKFYIGTATRQVYEYDPISGSTTLARRGSEHAGHDKPRLSFRVMTRIT